MEDKWEDRFGAARPGDLSSYVSSYGGPIASLLRELVILKHSVICSASPLIGVEDLGTERDSRWSDTRQHVTSILNYGFFSYSLRANEQTCNSICKTHRL